MITIDDLGRLEKPLYLEVSDGFRLMMKNKIFEHFGSLRQFSAKTKTFTQGSHLGVILRGEKCTSVGFWLNLSDVLGVPKHELVKNILKVRSRNPKSVFIEAKQLPICFSPELALVVGHSLGDGHINTHSGIFNYTNTSLRLQRVVLNSIHTTFGTKRHKESSRLHGPGQPKVYTWSYPKIIGDFLQLSGSVKGNKIRQSYNVPEWVMNGTLDIKKAFIRALFDDESTVKIDGKELLIKFSKEASKVESLRKFLEQLGELLGWVGIEITSIKRGNVVYGKNGKTIQLILGIHGHENFKLFDSKISLDHPEKKKQMKLLIDSYKRFKLRDGVGQRLVYEKLVHQKTVIQLAHELNMSPLATYKHLRKLEAKGLVTQAKMSRNKLAIWMKI
jgi:intein/homing endonuclease